MRLFESYIVAFILWLITSTSLYGNELKFKSYDHTYGLNNSTVTDIYKDNNGRLWIGTSRGASLFTGTEFISLGHFVGDSIHQTLGAVNVINELDKNELWIGTSGDGIYSVNIETGKYKHFRINTENLSLSISNSYINCIYNRNNENLWIGTAYGLNVTNGNGKFEQYLFEETLTKGDPNILAIIPKYEQLVILFTNLGEIIELNTETGTYNKVAEVHLDKAEISNVVKDSLGNFWIGTKYNGLFLIDQNYIELELPDMLRNIQHYPIMDLQLDHSGNVFIATDGKGLFKVDANTLNVSHIQQRPHDQYSLVSNQLQSIFIDEIDILWTGYFKDGLSRTLLENDGISHFYKTSELKPGLPNNIINCFTEDSKGHIWIGTESGISIYDRKNKNYQLSQNLYTSILRKIGDQPITAIHYSHRNNVVSVGTYNSGLYQINLNSKRIKHYNAEKDDLQSNFIRSIIEDEKERYLLATIDGGLHALIEDKVEPIFIYHKDGYKLNDFFHLSQDSSNVWLSSAGGGTIKVSKDNLEGEMYTNLDGRLSYSSATLSDSSFYVGTDKGLYKYSVELNDFKPINILPEESDVFGIIEDSNGLLWLSSSTGLYRYNPNNNLLHTISSFNLQEKEYQPVSFFKLSDGCILFGGINGFNLINPDEYKFPDHEQSVFLSSFEIYNTNIRTGAYYSDHKKMEKHINFLDEIVIPYNVNFFSISTNVINYFYNNQNKIAYSMNKASDVSDLSITSGKMSFHNLPAGTYNLSIFPVNRDMTPQMSGLKKLTIIKESPWWEKTWFYTLLIFVISIALIAQYRNRIKRLKANKKHLEKTVNEKTIDLENKTIEIADQRDALKRTLQTNKQLEGFKESVISMIIHDLKNPLNSIIGLSSLNDPIFIKHIHNASRQMLHLVENILDVRKYETNSLKLFLVHSDLKQLSNEAIEEVSFLLKQKNNRIINNTFSFELQLDPDIIRRVYVNLLTNAIKFSPENGPITLNSEINDSHIIISISDEGAGIAIEDQDSIFDLYQQIDAKKSGKVNSTGIGLSFCKMAIEEHQGKIWVDSQYKKGSRFIFKLPINK